MTPEPQSTDDRISTNPAMITTFTTLDVDVTTTGSTFTTSEVSNTYHNFSQDRDLANNTVTELLGKFYSNACKMESILLPSGPDETQYEDRTEFEGPFRKETSLAIGVATSVLVIFIVTLTIFALLLLWKYKRTYLTCLLYTSPSPRDATLSRMPSSA